METTKRKDFDFPLAAPSKNGLYIEVCKAYISIDFHLPKLHVSGWMAVDIRFRLWVCINLLLLLIMFSLSASGTRNPFSMNQRKTAPLMESVREVINLNIQKQEAMGPEFFNQSMRLSPGGPDPHHH
ncbi:hypothetical protein SAY87_002992 [Trapa incisa]|uniref:Uncharacterized protein n=1 Tax=Trapa incisa TaxID=236973 RepID=A0AAN7QH34_9MYRT|nr:hypothetical protein SAY87_002992 [Trapa incisa]